MDHLASAESIWERFGGGKTNTQHVRNKQQGNNNRKKTTTKTGTTTKQEHLRQQDLQELQI